MARAFVAFYMGDYQKKTQHLDTLQHGAYFLLLQHCWTHGSIPLEPSARAAIARMTPQQWRKVAPVLNAFFDAEGRNKRATEEVEKAERVSLKRALAGQRGGFASGIAKAKQIGSRPIANASPRPKQPHQQNEANCIPIQNSKITTSEFDAAREALPNPEQNELLASLERLKERSGRKVFVEIETPEWAAHNHARSLENIKPLIPVTVVIEGVEKTGQWLATKFPAGYDEATGERIAPKSDEEAA